MKPIYIILISLFSLLFLNNCSNDSASNDSIPSQNSGGQGGSLARFCIANNYLYVVDNATLHIYSLAQPDHPETVGSVNLGIGIETIFYYEDFLYIGSTNGMIIYSIANPRNPTRTGIYSHVTSCDPVVVQGDIAYVTLRTGNRCNTGINLLDVVDVSDKSNPKSLKSINMLNPWGLAVDGRHLFVCDETISIVYFDLSDPKNPSKKKVFFPTRATDLIASNNVLLSTGADGIVQYDYSNAPASLDLLSKIEIGK